jgi:2-methylcitrate dehydratase PrpD
MTTLVERLVDFGAAARFETLPAEVVSEAKRLLLDSIGCALAAVTVDKGRRAIEVARQMGGPAKARVIGSGDTLSTFAAVFANGELINALDFDALTIPPGHVTPYVLPAILATAERERASGRSLLRAIAVAHEVCTRFGQSMGYYRDVKPGQKIVFPSVAGFSSTVFGGTLGTAMLHGLDGPTTAHALGLAGHIAPVQALAKWGRTVPGADSKYLVSGWIGQAELLAVLMAEQGYRGDIEVLEGDYGFWRFVGSSKWNPEPLVDRLGAQWLFPAVTIYKPYPHCRGSHTVLDCLRHLIDEHRLAPHEIEQVTAYWDSHTAALPLYCTRTIETPSDAQMSAAYAVSMVVHGVKNGPEWYDRATMTDPALLAFMDKVVVQAHPGFEEALLEDPQSRIGKVEVKARGQTFGEERRYRKGSPATAQTRMSDAELVSKFEHNASRVLDAATSGRVARTILQLEEIDDVSDVARLW